MKRAIATAISFITILTLFTGCGLFGRKSADVRIGIPATAGGAALAAIAAEQGYFEDEGINAVISVKEDTTAIAAGMRSAGRTLDCGYIDAGSAWNVLDTTGNGMTFLFLDSLSNADALIARKGQFTDSNSNGFYDYLEIYEGLKGKTVYIDTSSTSGGWFKDLLYKIHTVLALPDSGKLWISCDVPAYLDGYTAPNSDEANRVTVVDTGNEEIAGAIARTGEDRADIAVGFAPVPETILATSSEIEKIASSDTHLADKYFPSTWAASSQWISENPAMVQKVVNALYRAMEFRAASGANRRESLAAAERLAGKPEGSFTSYGLVWPTKAEYKEWFANAESMGYTYMKSLYEAKKYSVPAGSTAKVFDECFDDTYILASIADIG